MRAFDPLGALEVLSAHEIDFVLIGGLAARLHGSPTVTDDLDICHSAERDNLERLAEALRQMEAKLRVAPADVPFPLDARTLAAGANFTFSTNYGPLDCMALPAGVNGYDELSRTADRMRFDDLEVLVASIDDLILMKRAAGRPQDLKELEILGALKEELERGNG
ncbi:MAG: DUF6036 family nucleotidyltransferase [Actinomycetota bacterium]